MPEFRFREPMSDVSLPSSARLTYYWMRTLAREDERCYASVPEIAKRVGITPEQLSTQITALEKAGYIARESAKGLGTGRRRFKILSALAAAAAAHAIGTAPVSASVTHLDNQAAVSERTPFRAGLL